MTAGWRRRDFPSARRSNRRIVLLVVAVIVLGVVVGEVAADVVDSGRVAGRVAAETYVAAVIPVIDESTSLASTMHLVRDGAAQLDRVSLEQSLGDLVTDTAQNEAQLLSLGVPAPTARSGRLLEAALGARADGARDLAGAVALALGPAPGAQERASAVSLIVRAGRELVTGDEDYVEFQTGASPLQPARTPPDLEMGGEPGVMDRCARVHLGRTALRRGRPAGP